MLKAQKKSGFVEHNQSHGERKALKQPQITFIVKKLMTSVMFWLRNQHMGERGLEVSFMSPSFSVAAHM